MLSRRNTSFSFQFEDQLRKLHGAADEAAQEQAKAQAILLYYNSRMIAVRLYSYRSVVLRRRHYII